VVVKYLLFTHTPQDRKRF